MRTSSSDIFSLVLWVFLNKLYTNIEAIFCVSPYVYLYIYIFVYSQYWKKQPYRKACYKYAKNYIFQGVLVTSLSRRRRNKEHF